MSNSFSCLCHFPKLPELLLRTDDDERIEEVPTRDGVVLWVVVRDVDVDVLFPNPPLCAVLLVERVWKDRCVDVGLLNCCEIPLLAVAPRFGLLRFVLDATVDVLARFVVELRVMSCVRFLYTFTVTGAYP